MGESDTPTMDNLVIGKFVVGPPATTYRRVRVRFVDFHERWEQRERSFGPTSKKQSRVVLLQRQKAQSLGRVREQFAALKQSSLRNDNFLELIPF